MRCGVDFAIPDWLLAECRNTKRVFWCPSCNSELIFNESEADRLRKEKQRLEEELERKQQALDNERTSRLFWTEETRRKEKALSVQKGQVTRLKNRAKAGACPECNRTFTQLQRHMKSQHPGFHTEAPAT